MTIRTWAAAAAAATIALAGPAFAGETSSTTIRDSDGHVERVIVFSDSHRERHQDGAGDQGQRVRVYGMADAAIAHCGDQPLVERSSADGQQKTRVVICSDHEVNVADRTTRLEHVMERIQNMDGLSDASKERVTQALREAIDQLRSGR
jgi:hypothetical protein